MTGASFGVLSQVVELSGRISILANDFPALHAVVSKAEEVQVVLLRSPKPPQNTKNWGPALTANPADIQQKS